MRGAWLAVGTAFASSVVMSERRDGTPDRRVSRRGGRRQSDPARQSDTLRTKWEELASADSASSPDAPAPDDDEIVTEPPHLGHVRRSPFPPRK